MLGARGSAQVATSSHHLSPTEKLLNPKSYKFPIYPLSRYPSFQETPHHFSQQQSQSCQQALESIRELAGGGRMEQAFSMMRFKGLGFRVRVVGLSTFLPEEPKPKRKVLKLLGTLMRVWIMLMSLRVM